MDAVKDYEVVEKRKVKYTSDWTLWACYIILCVVSVIEVFSASSLDLKNGSVYLPIESHVKFLLMGLVADYTTMVIAFVVPLLAYIVVWLYACRLYALSGKSTEKAVV